MNIHTPGQKIFIPVLLCLATLLVATGCSRSEPELRSSKIQLLKVQSPSGGFSERLSVFVFFEDADGPSDFGSITVTHVDSGIFWKLLPGDCVVRLRGKDRWTGSNNLAGPGDSALPEGAYSLIVTDLAGNEVGSEFTLSRPGFPERAPVSFSVTGDTWNLSRNAGQTDFRRTYLMLHDRDDRLLATWRVTDESAPKTSGSLQGLRILARDVARVRCYTENEAGTAGVLLSPVDLR